MIASIVAILGSYTLNCTMSFVHQFDLLALRKAVTILLLVVGVVRKEVFDPQKRLFVLHKEDVSASSPAAQHRSTFMHACMACPKHEDLELAPARKSLKFEPNTVTCTAFH